MCRHAAYIGPGICLNELMADLDHCLLKQSYQARELLTGVVCADGYGVAWYDDDMDQAARYAYAEPIWSDTNLASMGRVIRSNLVMGAVRNATIAGQNTQANCQPFQAGQIIMSHNGYLADLPQWLDLLRDMGGTQIHGDTDSERIFRAILAQAAKEEGEEGLAVATQSVLRTLCEFGGKEGLTAQLNILIADGDQIVATRAGTSPTQNSLYTLQDGDEFPGGWVVASEPLYDDPEWQVVAPDSVISLRRGAPAVRLTV